MSVSIYNAFRIVFGTLYPAYASYKAVKTKNVKEYVKWMMYWIVFALFTCAETIADIFVAWIPFYYELKIVFVLWLLSPATKGSSILYRKFVHPQLAKREKEIDSYISKASDQGYSALITLGSRGINYATNVVLSTAIKGQSKIADHLRKSYSLNDLSQDEQLTRQDSNVSDMDDETDNRLIEESYQREMLEREMSGQDGDDVRVRKRPSLRSKDAESLLQPLEEHEEEDDGHEKAPRKKLNYSHKEALSQSTPATPTSVLPRGYQPFASYKQRSSSIGDSSPTELSDTLATWRLRSSYKPSLKK